VRRDVREALDRIDGKVHDADGWARAATRRIADLEQRVDELQVSLDGTIEVLRSLMAKPAKKAALVKKVKRKST
jgi:hypothetical protein